MNFDRSELAYEDGPHAARRRCILGSGRATVLRQFRVRSGGSRQAQADEWQQRARSGARETENGKERFATWEAPAFVNQGLTTRQSAAWPSSQRQMFATVSW